MDRLAQQAMAQEKDPNEIVLNVPGGVLFLKDIFRNIVENVKLRFNGSTGDKKTVKAFFNVFRGQPQVTFKYGQKYYRFDLTPATEEEMQYNKRNNFK